MAFLTNLFLLFQLIVSTILSPLIFLERTLPQPVYQIRRIFNSHIIKPADFYTIVLVGDSMTAYLGNADELTADLKKYYPSKKINFLNYGFSSTNITSVPERLEKATNYEGRVYSSILSNNFDLILIESMANNPLSTLPLDIGLKKQTEALDQIVKMITDSHPNSIIVFVATVSPYKQRYAEGVENLTTEERIKWANERVAYLKNHIQYAKEHKIGLINIYEKTIDKNGEGNIDYINTNDFIHPSPTGVFFISQQIADYIYNNRLLPL